MMTMIMMKILLKNRITFIKVIIPMVFQRAMIDNLKINEYTYLTEIMEIIYIMLFYRNAPPLYRVIKKPLLAGNSYARRTRTNWSVRIFM